jgi:spore germination cell wall hydrolase CwlJ-like protein
MSRFQVSWAMGVVAPWCLGIGLVVSMAADAGQDATIGASLAPPGVLAAVQPGDLIPATVSGPGFGLARSPVASASLEARLYLGDPMDFTQVPDEIAPRVVLKSHAHAVPDIDRSRKGDPAVGLRPTFSSQFQRKSGLRVLRAGQMIFAAAENLQSEAFAPGAAAAGAETFTPWPSGESPTTTPSRADASPGQPGSSETMRPANLAARLMQGATPEVGRAAALASMTPATDDATPVEVVAVPTLPPADNAEISRVPAARPDYTSLIDEDQQHHEQRCLAQAIYFEARGESDTGQAAVAQVVLNRVSSGLYPSTICGVVFQNRQHYHACQFSFACEGRSLRITEPDAWHRAERIAAAVTSGETYVADVGDATHYHALYVHPDWARRLERTDRIGHHVFYKLKRGQI